MATPIYTRLRIGWGLIDLTLDPEAPAFDAGNTDNVAGDLATARRCVIWFDRASYGQDRMQTHLDLVNMTGGAVDPTWTAGDFAAVEAALNTFWTSVKPKFHTALKLGGYRWYRLGPGATPPEPVVRVTDTGVAGTGSSNPIPHQCAITISLRTALRAHWGRMYLPNPTYGDLDGGGGYSTGMTDLIGNSFHTMLGTLAAADFLPIVYSKTKSRAYSVERVIVDNVPDVQRRRRVAGSGYQNTHHA